VSQYSYESRRTSLGSQSVLPQGLSVRMPVRYSCIASAGSLMRCPSCSAGLPLFCRSASTSVSSIHWLMEMLCLAQCLMIWFFSQPGTVVTMLYRWLLLRAGSGVRGIAFDEGCDVFGDCHVVSVGEFYDLVF
jgi:hypothetical protein